MDWLLDDWDTKIAALLPFFYDLTLYCGASILGWGVPGDGDSFFPDIYNLRLTHLSQRLYTEENQISTVQSEFIDSKLHVCVMCLCINMYVGMYGKKSRKVTCMFRFIHGHNLFLILSLPSTSLCHFKCWNISIFCTYSKNELFLRWITEWLINAFPKP